LEEMQREIKRNIPDKVNVRGVERLALWIAGKLQTSLSWQVFECKQHPGSILPLHNIEDRLEREQEQQPKGWHQFARAWRNLPQAGVALLTDVEPFRDNTVHLPKVLWPFPHQKEQAELILRKYWGKGILWVASKHRTSGHKRSRQEADIARKRPDNTGGGRPGDAEEEEEAQTQQVGNPLRPVLAQLLAKENKTSIFQKTEWFWYRVQEGMALLERSRPRAIRDESFSEPSITSAPFEPKPGESKRLETITLLPCIMANIGEGASNAEEWWESLEEAGGADGRSSIHQLA